MGREKQRFHRRMKEEMLDLRNCYGAEDPTPYDAVRNLYFNRLEVKKCNFTEHGCQKTSRGANQPGLFCASTYQWPEPEYRNTCRKSLDLAADRG